MLIENYYRYVNRKLLQIHYSKLITDTFIKSYDRYNKRKLLQIRNRKLLQIR